MRIGWTVEASGDVANLSNDEQQDPDQDKLDGLTDVNSEPDFGAGATQAALNASPHPDDAAVCRHCGEKIEYTKVPYKGGFWAHSHSLRKPCGEPASKWGANSDELSTEPLGYDDNDMDDFNTGTTGPTVTQTDINPDNSFSGSRKLASGIVVEGSWTDVQSKAQRIYKNGGVRIISVTGPYIAAHVKGDDGVYETTLQRGKTGSIDQWTCSCPWFAYSFGRSGRWKRYEGRMCSHALALQYEAQSQGMFGRDIHEQSQTPDWDDEVTYYTAPPPKEWRASFRPEPTFDDLTDVASADTELNAESLLLPVSTGIEPSDLVDLFESELRTTPQDNSFVFASSSTPPLPHVGHVVGMRTWDEMGYEVDTDGTVASMSDFEFTGVGNEVYVRPTMSRGVGELAVPHVIERGGPVPTLIVSSTVDMGPEALLDSHTHTAQYSTVLPTPATRVASRLYGAEQPREDNGRWTNGMGEVTPKGYGKITPGEARGDSKKVTPQEFDDLADKGKKHYDSLMSNKRPTTAFDDAEQWATIRSGAYDAAQEKWGGQTLDPETGRAVKRSKGFSLEVRAPGEKQLSVHEDADEDTFNAMMDRARKEYAEKLEGSQVYLGVFRDDDNHRIDFDPVTIVATEDEVDALGAYTHAVGGAYNFSTGNGHFPPHVASLASDVKESVLMWSTIKVNNQKAVPNPEHDGFRYAFHQILGDVGAFRYNASNPDFMKGEHLATVFLKAFMDNQVPSHRPLYRAIGLHPDAYMTILTSCQSGSIDLPPASWSANKALTEQFGLDYAQGTKFYEERIIFVTRPGSQSWALGRASNTGYEREHIVGGRFHVVSIKFPPETDNTTVITLQEAEAWPDDFGAKGDLIEHMAFDSAVVSPQDTTGKTSRYLTIDEARAGAINYSLPMTASDDHVDPHKGTMIAVRPPDSLCGALALDTEDAESYEQLHVTLAYIGPDESDALDLDTLREIVEAQARLSPYISATLAGHGTFENPEGDVSVVLVDSEELQVARALLVSALARAGIEISHLHGFTPHITLTYGDPGELETVDSQPFLFTEFIISPPSGEWEHYALNNDLPHTAAVVVADQENPIPPTENAEPSWGSTPISQDDPSGSPMDSDGGVDTVLPGAQAVLDEEPEGALPSTDGDAGADGAQSDQDYYPTDEQDNTHLYGGEGAAPSTIAWLDPSISNEEVKGNDDMDIAAAARNYLMTSTAVKSFTYAEQQEIINEGEGVTAANLDRLSLEGTHYEALEQQLATAEALGEPVVWW